MFSLIVELLWSLKMTHVFNMLPTEEICGGSMHLLLHPWSVAGWWCHWSLRRGLSADSHTQHWLKEVLHMNTSSKAHTTRALRCGQVALVVLERHFTCAQYNNFLLVRWPLQCQTYFNVQLDPNLHHSFGNWTMGLCGDGLCINDCFSSLCSTIWILACFFSHQLLRGYSRSHFLLYLLASH